MIKEIELEKVSTLDNPQLVDVRELFEREKHHIGGIHIPLKEIEKRIDELDLSRPIVIYCRGGVRSLHAANTLEKHAPTVEAYSIKGGIG